MSKQTEQKQQAPEKDDGAAGETPAESTVAPPPALKYPQGPHVYVAIQQVQGMLAVEGIGKDSRNEQQKFNFRGIDAVYNELAKFLPRAGLTILPRVTHMERAERESNNGKALFSVFLTVEYDLVSSVDGTKHTVCVIGEAMDSGDKATNKAMSAAYKYMCFQAFCIPTEGDNDADATTHEVRAKQQRYPAHTHVAYINGANTMDELQKAFALAWHQYTGDSQQQQDFKTIYDDRKAELLEAEGRA